MTPGLSVWWVAGADEDEAIDIAGTVATSATPKAAAMPACRTRRRLPEAVKMLMCVPLESGVGAGPEYRYVLWVAWIRFPARRKRGSSSAHCGADSAFD